MSGRAGHAGGSGPPAPARRSAVLADEGLGRLGAVVASHVGDDRVPGLVALVAAGEQVHVEVAGTLVLGGPPVRRDSLFRIASTSKPVVGVATLALVEAGLLSLDEPVDRLLPELAGRRVLRRPDGPLDDTVPANRAVTVRDLLTFTFGFGMAMEMFAAPEPWPVVREADALHLCTLGPPSPAEQPDPDTWMAGLGSLPLVAQPGERWLYNTGASVLGVLVARASGTTLAEVLRQRVFEPLGMRDTGFWTAGTTRLGAVYGPGPGGLSVWDPPGGAWSRAPAFGDAAAGLLSTADDLLLLARALAGGGGPVLGPGSVRAMTADQLTGDQRRGAAAILGERSWGLCTAVHVAGPRAGAFGWDGGLGTSWLVDPVRGLTVVVLTNRMFDSPRPPAVHVDVQDAAYGALAR